MRGLEAVAGHSAPALGLCRGHGRMAVAVAIIGVVIMLGIGVVAYDLQLEAAKMPRRL